MPLRRLHHLIARLTLAWFALALGVAAAAPLVQPRAMQLVCSASGAVKLLVDTGDGLVEAGQGHLDCALCLLTSAPPPAIVTSPPAPHGVPRAAAWQATAPAAPLRTALPALPARGPPLSL